MQRADSSGDMTMETDGGGPRPSDFAAFVATAEPRLRQAYIGWCGVDDARDATAEALAWAWEHWDELQTKTNPHGFLFRVGQSRTRQRMQGRLPMPEELLLPDIEPGLIPALGQLTLQQRTAVWLVHACGFTYAECAEAMGISASAVGTHLARGMEALRQRLDVEPSEERDA
jgi:DNA-directed RNA polymerase specialized sigma24 family protein